MSPEPSWRRETSCEEMPSPQSPSAGRGPGKERQSGDRKDSGEPVRGFSSTVVSKSALLDLDRVSWLSTRPREGGRAPRPSKDDERGDVTSLQAFAPLEKAELDQE
jgi:hypothetical protein